MRDSEYLIVHKSILPPYFEQVIAARELINNQKINICDACKMQSISRSTYYKYKDFIFRPTIDSGNKAQFLLSKRLMKREFYLLFYKSYMIIVEMSFQLIKMLPLIKVHILL